MCCDKVVIWVRSCIVSPIGKNGLVHIDGISCDCTPVPGTDKPPSLDLRVWLWQLVIKSVSPTGTE